MVTYWISKVQPAQSHPPRFSQMQARRKNNSSKLTGSGVVVPFSSVSDLVVFTAKNLDQYAHQAGRIFVHMVAETIVELGESGVQVYD